jgi:hypothetical protein
MPPGIVIELHHPGETIVYPPHHAPVVSSRVVQDFDDISAEPPLGAAPVCASNIPLITPS